MKGKQINSKRTDRIGLVAIRKIFFIIRLKHNIVIDLAFIRSAKRFFRIETIVVK